LFEREEYKGRLKATYRAVKASEEEIKRRHKNAVKELNSSFKKKKNTLHKKKPGVSEGGGGGGVGGRASSHT